MKRILVTGAAGFIGFHLCQALKARGDFVLGLDNFNSYYTPLLKERRAALLEAAGISVLKADCCDKASLLSLFETEKFTHVAHLAAQAGVRYARSHPEAYLKSNLEGFLSLLETLKHHPQTKLVYASSSSVYGTNEKIPFSVTDPTDHPANFYAATKKANELMAYSYHHLHGISMVGLRYFTVYGPWGRPDMAAFLFAEAITKGKPLHLFNKGQMKRDFTYISDAIEGTLAALDYDTSFEVFNLGNCHPEPLFKLVELLEEELGKKAKIILEEPSPGEVEVTYADIQSATEKLGFIPQIPLSQGIKEFIKWYKKEWN